MGIDWISIAIAAIAAIGGAVTAGVGVDTQKKEIARRKEKLEQDKKDTLELMDLNFSKDKNEANKSADRSDEKSTMNEKLVSQDTNNQIEQIQLNQEKEALDFNNAAINNGQNVGNALSDMGSSGVRAGSSLAEAVDLQKSLNAVQLQNQEDISRKSDQIALANVLNNLQGNRFGIQADRTDAYDTRMAYEEGGDIHDIYKLQRKQQSDNFDYGINELNRQYADLDQNGFWYVLGGMFNGGQTGVQIGGNVQKLATDIGSKRTAKTNTSMNLLNSNQPMANMTNNLFGQSVKEMSLGSRNTILFK